MQEQERLVAVRYNIQREEVAIEKKWKVISRNLNSFHPVWAHGIPLILHGLNILPEPLGTPRALDPEQKDSEAIFRKLDKAEFGPRMRCKLKRNYRGSKHEEASHQHWSQVRIKKTSHRLSIYD